MTLQIDDVEIESFIDQRYGMDMQSLLQDFTSFVKASLGDSYPSITADIAQKRVSKALDEIDNGTATMLTQEEYEKEMQVFMQAL